MAQAPRRRRKEARPGEILEAAFEAFAEHGYDRTTLADVARRAGVAKGTIYLYYADKAALFQAAVRSEAGGHAAQLEAMLAAYDGPTDVLLRQVIQAMHARLASPRVRTMMRIVITEGRRFPDLVAFYHAEAVTRMRGLAEAVVARGVARGEFAANAAADLPMVVGAPGVMAAVYAMTFDAVDPIAPERFLAAHIDLVLDGLRRR